MEQKDQIQDDTGGEPADNQGAEPSSPPSIPARYTSSATALSTVELGRQDGRTGAARAGQVILVSRLDPNRRRRAVGGSAPR